jgi:hypothetical protein
LFGSIVMIVVEKCLTDTFFHLENAFLMDQAP